MKTKLFLFVLIAIAATACKSNSTTPDPTPEQIDLLGTWRSVESADTLLTTNNRTIVTYLSSTKKQMSLSQYIPEFEEYTWRNKAMGSYSFDGVNLKMDAADARSYLLAKVAGVDKQSIRVNYHTYVNKNGDSTAVSLSEVYERVSDNLGYEQSIIGMWEGVKHTGEQTFGDEHHRWEYKDIDRAGYYTYVYYSYDSLAGEWVAEQETISDYNVHGNWLATRWQPVGALKTEYEWWDIDFITDTTMQWSALRSKSEGSGTFLATFTFRRVL